MKTQIKNILIVFISVLLVHCSKDDGTQPETKSSEKELISFIFKAVDNDVFNQDINGIINQENKVVFVMVPYGTDVTALTPTIEISPKAKIMVIRKSSTLNFATPVVYEVTAEDDSKVVYTVRVRIATSDQKQILNFVFMADDNSQLIDDIQGAVNENKKIISVIVPNGTDVNPMVPRIEVSPDATVSPEGSQNFNNPVTYTITAEDGTIVEYIVKVIDVSTLQRNVLTRIYNTNSSNTLGWDLNDDDIGNWEGVLIDGDGYVTALRMNDKGITVLPPDISFLNNLTVLSIKDNQLNVVPTSIGSLTKLIILALGDNKLTAIPTEIYKLSNLNTLGLGNNQLTSISNEIGNLTNLIELRLNNNKLSSIPIDIGKLINLDILDLEGNQLTTIPQEVCDLKTNNGTDIIVGNGVICQ